MIYIICAVCVVFGFIFGRLSIRTCGTLLIDGSSPEKDIWRLQMDTLDGIENRKRIILKVDPKANLSQN